MSVYDDDDEITPYRKIIELNAGGTIIKFDSNDISIETAEQINDMYAIARGKTAYKTLASTPRNQTETVEEYNKRLDESDKLKDQNDPDNTFRRDGESEEDWYKRIFSQFRARQTAFSVAFHLINGAQKIIYGEKARELTEENFKKVKPRELLMFCHNLMLEAGVKSTPEFDPDPKS